MAGTGWQGWTQWWPTALVGTVGQARPMEAIRIAIRA
ncbi:hypothetical protein ACFYT4_28835 [Streptomyces sp. NPDC004609]